MSALCEQSAVALRALIGARAISPVEVLDACLERIDAVDGMVNAMPTVDRDRARIAAKRAETAVMRGESLGPLHGLPLGIKDLSPTAGLRTTFGSLLHKDYIPAADDGTVAALRQAGGIILGKTNTPEFGAGANTINKVFGATRNPFDPTRTCAGSSGGSAVALACSMIPVASGSDMGGSLRTPAAFCGIVGFRPTAGTVPSETRSFGWSPLGIDGPMGRTVADTILQLDVLRRVEPDDPLSPLSALEPVAAHPPVDLQKLAVAFSADLGFAPMSAASRAVFEARIARLAPIFAVADRADPPIADADEAFDVLRGVSFVAANGNAYRNRRDDLGPNVVANTAFGLSLDVTRIARAEMLHTRVFRAFRRFMGGWDLLITPAAAVSPFTLDHLYVAEIDGVELATYYRWLAITYAITVTGNPAVVIPCGRDALGLPFGIQIVGRRGADAFVLRAAEALEAILADDPEMARPVPDLAALM